MNWVQSCKTWKIDENRKNGARFVLRIVEYGVVVGGPPCSLLVAASSSVHRRRPWRLLGDTSNSKVRLSNRIWENCVPTLLMMGRVSAWEV